MAVSREQALRLYTMGSADVDFMEDRAGWIEAGKLADLAVLSDDYMTVGEDRIGDLRSVLTIIDGRLSAVQSIAAAVARYRCHGRHSGGGVGGRAGRVDKV